MNPEVNSENTDKSEPSLNAQKIRFMFDAILQGGLGKNDYIVSTFFGENSPYSTKEIYDALILYPNKYAEVIIKYSKYLTQHMTDQDLATLQEEVGEHPLYSNTAKNISLGGLN